MANSNFHLAYRPDIDGLRAIAILSVVIFHAFPTLIPGGFVGVDIFFVISGFLISTIIFKSIDKGRFSFSDFYIKRAKRIFPVLIIVLFTCLTFGYFSFYPPEYAQLSKHIASSSIFISNFILWSEAGYFDTASTTKPLLHLWSLAIEEQFYLFWPILSVLLFKLGRRFFIITSLIVISSFIYGLYLTKVDATAAFYSPLSRFWELGIGSALAWFTLISKNSLNKTNLNIVTTIGIALIILSFAILDETKSFPGYWALLPTLGAAFVILGGPSAVVNRYFLSIKPVVWIGLISYPLYLWHWPLLTYINITSNDFILKNIETAKLLALLLSFFLAILSYLFIEKPIKKIKNPKAISILATLLLIIVGSISLYIYKKDGLITRVPPELQELAAITSPYEFFQFGENVRQYSCHFIIPQAEARKEECFGKSRPLLMIWGDSFAAALYPGINTLSKQHNFGITQVTAGNSPPFLFEDKIAADGNSLLKNTSYAIDIIEKEKPELILISWMISGMNAPSSYQATIDALRESLIKVKGASPNSQIVLVGPVPQWKKNLYIVVLDFLKDKPMNTKIGDYMSFGLEPGYKEWDQYLALEVPKLGVKYISAYNALCGDSGCRVKVGDGALNLTAVDFGHLTKAGSEYLASKISGDIVRLMETKSQ